MLLLVTLGLAGCGSGELSAGDRVFDGLDQKVVQEVLAFPGAQQNVAGLPKADKASMWQGMVGAFVMCRQFLQTYETWRDTGVPPETHLTPTAPSHPEDSFADVQTLYEYFSGLVEAGDIGDFRTALTGDGSCGQWIPATPGGSQTIAEVIRAEG